MVNPQKENGYTPIAHELFEAFYRCKLLEYERVLVMAIWRKTYGWCKKEDWVSNSQLSTETGIPPSHITRTIKQLKEKCIVEKNGKKISVNKHYNEWAVEWRKLPHQVTKVTSPGNKKLPHQVPTKEKKETIQKKPSESVDSQGNNSNETMNPWNRKADDYVGETIEYETGRTLSPDEETKTEAAGRDYRATDIVDYWNQFGTFADFARVKKLTGNPRNPSTKQVLLPQARSTKDLLLAIGVCMKRYEREDFEYAIDNHIREVINRAPTDTWMGKRYSLYDLVKNKGYLLKTYVNK